MSGPKRFAAATTFALILTLGAASAREIQQCDLAGKRIFSFDTTCGATGCTRGESLYFITKDKILEYIPQSVLDKKTNVSAFRFNGRENVGIIYTRGATVEAQGGDAPGLFRMRSLPDGWKQVQTVSSNFSGMLLSLELRNRIITAGDELFGETVLYSRIEISDCNSCRILAKGTHSYSVEKYNEKSIIADVRLKQNHWCRLENADLGNMPR